MDNKITGTQHGSKRNTASGIDNISYISDMIVGDCPSDPAQVHRPRDGHRENPDTRQGAHDTQRFSFDLDGGNRRSRHYGISDTNVLTSPNDPQKTDCHSSVSSSRRSPPGTVRDNHSSSSIESSGRSVSDRSSTVSNVSVLRQTSTFSLELTPSEHHFDASGNMPDREVKICVYPALSSTGFYEQNQAQKNPVVAQLSRTRSQIDKSLKQARVPRDSHIRRFVRQVSGRKNGFEAYVNEYNRAYNTGNAERPKSYFDLAILTMCCCLSPIGFAAVVLSVLSDANYKASHMDKAKKYGKISMTLSILGIITTLVTSVTLLLVLAYPWDNIVDL